MSLRLRPPMLLVFLPLLLAGCASPPAIDLAADGRSVAVSRGETGIAWVHTDGSGTETLPGTENGSAPRWSPDGSKLLFSVEDRVAFYDLPERRVQALAPELGPPFAWSPDGRQVAGFYAPEEGPIQLRVLNFPGGDVAARVPLPFEGTGSAEGPVWLDAETLALVGTEGGKSNLYLVRGEQVRQWTHTNDVVAVGLGTRPGTVSWARRAPYRPAAGLAVWSGDLRAGAAAPVPGPERLPGVPRLGEGESVQVDAVRFSPGGTHLAVVATLRGRGAVYSGRVGGALHRVQQAAEVRSRDEDGEPQTSWEGLDATWSGDGSTLAVRSTGEKDRIRCYTSEGQYRSAADLPSE